MVPMNINRYDPFLINTLDTFVRWVNMLTMYTPRIVVYLLHAAGEYCILLML